MSGEQGGGMRGLLRNLEDLLLKWAAKANDSSKAQRQRACSVVFGIEIGSRRIEEVEPASPDALLELLQEWESIRRWEHAGPAPKANEGVDLGIGLVIREVRRHIAGLRRPPSKARSGGTAANKPKARKSG